MKLVLQIAVASTNVSIMMRNPAGFLAIFLTAFGLLSQPFAAEEQNGNEPYLAANKFELPLNIDAVRNRWKSLGYHRCQIDGREKGWSNDEHTHPWHMLFAGKMGRMEFTIRGQRFVLKPGDELYYPSFAAIMAKNLHNSRSEWFACWKY